MAANNIGFVNYQSINSHCRHRLDHLFSLLFWLSRNSSPRRSTVCMACAIPIISEIHTHTHARARLLFRSLQVNNNHLLPNYMVYTITYVAKNKKSSRGNEQPTTKRKENKIKSRKQINMIQRKVQALSMQEKHIFYCFYCFVVIVAVFFS